MSVGLGQASGPQGNPVLWGKERAASPGLMGLGERETNHKLCLCLVPSSHKFPQPPYWLGAVLRSCRSRWGPRSHQGLAAIRGICVATPTPHSNKS